MEYIYKTKGTCSSKIRLDINDGIVTNVVFTGGCDGNLNALKSSGLVLDERRGQNIVYSLNMTVFQELMKWFFDFSKGGNK